MQFHILITYKSIQYIHIYTLSFTLFTHSLNILYILLFAKPDHQTATSKQIEPMNKTNLNKPFFKQNKKEDSFFKKNSEPKGFFEKRNEAKAPPEPIKEDENFSDDDEKYGNLLGYLFGHINDKAKEMESKIETDNSIIENKIKELKRKKEKKKNSSSMSIGGFFKSIYDNIKGELSGGGRDIKSSPAHSKEEIKPLISDNKVNSKTITKEDAIINELIGIYSEIYGVSKEHVFRF